MVAEVRQGDVVIVEFPFTDRDEWQIRPSVVVSSRLLGERWPLLWVVMVTSAARQRWPGDVAITAYEAAGLRTACYARTAKITNAELSRIRPIGRLEDGVVAQIMSEVNAAVARTSPIA